MQPIIKKALVNFIEPPDGVTVVVCYFPSAIYCVSLEIQTDFSTDSVLSSATSRIAIPNGMDSAIFLIDSNRIALGINTHSST